MKAVRSKVPPMIIPDSVKGNRSLLTKLLQSTWEWDPSSRPNIEQFLSNLNSIIVVWCSNDEKNDDAMVDHFGEYWLSSEAS
jgi:hypothetical protein